LKLKKEEKVFVPLEGRLNDSEDCIGFRIFFLREQECDVEVSEVKQIDFDNVKRRLKDGKSVFMTAISREELMAT